MFPVLIESLKEFPTSCTLVPLNELRTSWRPAAALLRFSIAFLGGAFSSLCNGHGFALRLKVLSLVLLEVYVCGEMLSLLLLCCKELALFGPCCAADGSRNCCFVWLVVCSSAIAGLPFVGGCGDLLRLVSVFVTVVVVVVTVRTSPVSSSKTSPVCSFTAMFRCPSMSGIVPSFGTAVTCVFPFDTVSLGGTGGPFSFSWTAVSGCDFEDKRPPRPRRFWFPAFGAIINVETVENQDTSRVETYHSCPRNCGQSWEPTDVTTATVRPGFSVGKRWP